MTSNTTPVHDELYYLDWVTFLVEGRLFKVPRYYFGRSEIFQTIFSLPTEWNSTEGLSDDTPFLLEGVSNNDFRNLLKAMYPLGEANQKPELQAEEWISVLKLSNMWMFLDLRKQAISALTGTPLLNQEAVKKIILAKEYKVETWLLDAYDQLAKREDTITVEEGSRMGMETALRMFQVREGFVQTKTLTRDYYGNNQGETSSTRADHDFRQSIHKVFEAELKEIESAFHPA